MTVSDKEFEALEERVKKIEKVIFAGQGSTNSIGNKQLTLAEIARRPMLKDANGQQKVAIIVGYFELEKNEGASKPEKLKNAWKSGKFGGKYHPSFLSRATGDLIRNNEDGSYDLTQAGEDFYREAISVTAGSAGIKK